MGVTDGYVGTTVKIVDHGPDPERWCLVVLGDGYRAGELAKYHTDVQAIVDRFRAVPPFGELWSAVNVHRVDVVSDESGADDPIFGGCPGATGATANTYFDASFCAPWGGTRIHRVLSLDEELARDVATVAVPERDAVLVVVNDAKYGGAGGLVAACTTHSASANLAIHELGHSAFALADEYDYDGTRAPAAEPVEPNVTLDPNRATIKWRDLVAESTPMPSSCIPGCPGCAPPATLPARGAVGAYEGARYLRCGVYRPLPNCFMRDYAPFCPVCSRVIRKALRPYLPQESVVLVTPGLDFGDVPEGLGGRGVTHHRAVVWEVVSERRLTFRVLAMPPTASDILGDGPPRFGLPFGSSSSVGPSAYSPVARARLWVSYTSGTAGDWPDVGGMRVGCDETGETWDVSLSGRTVRRPRSAVALVLDGSLSMAEGAGDGLRKIGKLREAAGIFVDVMPSGDGIGLVRFDSTALRLMDVEDVGDLSTGAGRATARGHITGSALEPSGATSIGAGVAEGAATLEAGQAAAARPYDVTAMVVLTDGIENRWPLLADAAAGITARTFAVGLGLPSNISTAALRTLAQGHDGFLLVTGTIGPDQRTLLTKYFLQILAGITSADVVVDPGGVLTRGVTQHVPFAVSEADYGLDVVVLTPDPKGVVVRLENPRGGVIDARSSARLGTTAFVTREGLRLVRLTLPAMPKATWGAEDGDWRVILSLAPRRTAPIPYEVVVHAHSNLTLRAEVAQKSLEPGAEVLLSAMLSEYTVPVTERARVWAEVTFPHGGRRDLALSPDGSGGCSGGFTTTASGVYVVRLRARGETVHGSRFERERTLTAVAVAGGDRPFPGLGSPSFLDLIGGMLAPRAAGAGR